MKWFRLWVDIINDIKMLQLTDYEYRMFTYLMAYAASIDSLSGELHQTFKSLSLHFHQRFNLFSRANETFQKLGLIHTDNNGNVVITNWNKRQYISDNAYARVKKFRDVNQKRNVSVTAPETETETDKKNNKKNVFIIPSLEEVTAYCHERKNGVDPRRWHDFYACKGWMVGKNKMKDWRAAVRTWEDTQHNNPLQKGSSW